MSLEFLPITPMCQDVINKYSSLRPLYISEGHFLNQFLWKGYYQTLFHVNDDFLFFKITSLDGQTGCFVPFCQKEHLVDAFLSIEQYFHQELHLPLRMYLVDEEALTLLTEANVLNGYEIIEDRDSFDYIYDAEKLKTLSGKAMHKKKNLLNGFLKTYDGHFSYEHLDCHHIGEIKAFHAKWLTERDICDKYSSITSEEDGIEQLFKHCGTIPCKIGGVRIDGNLEAYTIGSYDELTRTAYIHIEKANTNYHGLYNYINQQFLIHEFPDALYVNREDDLGQDNLRQAKLSYKPLRLEKKFNIFGSSF